MATYELVVDFMVRLEGDLSSGGGIALPDVLRTSLKALRKLVVGIDEKLTVTIKQKRLSDAVEHLAAALKDLNQDEIVQKVLDDVKPSTKPAEKLRSTAKTLAALLTVLQITALTALQTAGVENTHTVLWVDDHPEGNVDEVQVAKDLNIEVVQVKSTKEAMKWLSSHTNLRGKTPARFRIITDLHRDDEGDDAGKNLITSVREAGWIDTPVLCYTGENITALDLCAANTMVLATPSDDVLNFYTMSMTKDWASITKEAPAGASIGSLVDEDSEEMIHPPPKAPVKKAASAAKKAATQKKKGKAVLSDEDEEDDDDEGSVEWGAPKAAKKSSNANAKKSSSSSSKSSTKEAAEEAPVKKSAAASSSSSSSSSSRPKVTSEGTLILDNNTVDAAFEEEEKQAREEAERKAAAASKARAAEEDAKRKKIEEEAARKRKDAEEAARKKKEAEEAARKKKEEEEALARKKKEEEEARKRKAQEEAEAARRKAEQEEEERRKRIPRNFPSRDFEASGVPKTVDLGSTGSFIVRLKSSLKPTDLELDELTGDEKYDVTVQLVGNGVHADGLVEVNDDCTRSVTFFPTKASQYTANVRVNGAHVSGSPFDIEVVASKKVVSKKRKAVSDEEERPSAAPASPAKRQKPNEESLSRKPTVLQYEESDEDATGDKMFVISPPSKPKPSASSKQYKVQSDLDAPTLIIDEAPKSKASSSAAPAPTKAVSKPKMVFEDEDDGSTMPMDFVPPPVKASAATAAPPAERKKAPIVHDDEDEDSQEQKRQKLDDSSGLLRLDSGEEDEDGYNTGDSEIERLPARKRSAHSPVPENAQPPPAKKRSLIVDSDDDDDEPMVRHIPKAAPKKQAAPPPKPKIVSDDEDEIEPTLLI